MCIRDRVILQQKFIIFGEKVGKVAQVLAHGFKSLGESIRVDLGGALRDTFMEMAGFETLADEDNRLMMQARVEAIKWSEGLKFVNISMEELSKKYKQGTEDGAEWRKEMEAMNKTAEENAQVMVGGFGMIGNAMLTATQKWGEYKDAIIDSNMPVEAQIDLLAKARTELFTTERALDGVSKAQEEFKSVLEETGAVTKVMAETKLKIAIDNFNELSASGLVTKGSLKKLAQEIVTMSKDLDVKVSPAILRLADNTKKAKKAFDDLIPKPKELADKLNNLIDAQKKLMGMTPEDLSKIFGGEAKDFAGGVDVTEMHKAQKASIMALYEEYKILAKVYQTDIPESLKVMVAGIKNSEKVFEEAVPKGRNFGLMIDTMAPSFDEAGKASQKMAEKMRSTAEHYGMSVTKMKNSLIELVNLQLKFSGMPLQIPKIPDDVVRGYDEVGTKLKDFVTKHRNAFVKIAEIISSIGSLVGDKWGNILGLMASGLQTFVEGVKDGGKSIGEILESMSVMIGQIGGAIGEAISGVENSFAGLGASLGSTIGGMFGPLGSAIGSLAGGLLGGLFGTKKQKTQAEIDAENVQMWTDAIIDKYSKWGEVSEQTAKIISEEVVKKGMQGFIAVSKHFAKIIEDVGVTQSNVNELWDRADDIMDHYKQGLIGADDATQSLNDSFGLLLEGARKLGQEGSQAMIEFIKKARESGLELASVTAYVLEQLDAIPDALNTLITNAVPEKFRLMTEDELTKLGKWMEDFNDKFAENMKLNPEKIMDTNKFKAHVEDLKKIIGDDLVKKFEKWMDKMGKSWLDFGEWMKSGNADSEKAVERMGKRLDGLADIAVQSFNAMIASGRPWLESLKAMKEPMKNLIDQYKKLGLEIPKSLKPMARMIELMEKRPKLFENLDASIQILKSLSNSAYLTQESFDELAKSATRMAKAILNVDGNLNSAMKTMDLTNTQINQLLPMVSQFVGMASMFGLGVPAWMKSFVTKQLDVDWKTFKETAKAQANAGIATVDQLKKLVNQQKNDRRVQLDIKRNIGNVDRGIDGVRRAVSDLARSLSGREERGAQGGFEGYVPAQTQFTLHPGEYMKVWRQDEVKKKQPESVDSGGQNSVVFAPTYNMMDSSQMEAFVENQLFPSFLKVLNINKNDSRTQFRKAVRIE